MSILSFPFPSTSEAPAAGSSRIAGLPAALLRELRVRRALRQVQALDDASLLDMGISRGGIEDAVRHGRRRE